MAHDHLWTNLRQLSELKGTELVAGADADPLLTTKFSQETGCDRTFDDYEALLDETKLDAVFAFCATKHHADVVEMCAPRGIHVMVEKPMAATLEQADRMLVASKKHQTRLMVNWPTAWSRSLRTAKRLVEEGAIGDLWQFTWRGGHSGPEELGCSDNSADFYSIPTLMAPAPSTTTEGMVRRCVSGFWGPLRLSSVLRAGC